MPPTSSTGSVHWEPGQAKLPGMTVRRKNRRFWLLNLGTVCKRWLNLRQYVLIFVSCSKKSVIENFWSEKNDIIYLKGETSKPQMERLEICMKTCQKLYELTFILIHWSIFFEFWLSKLLEILHEICSPKNKLTDWSHFLVSNDFIHSLEDMTKTKITFEI